MHFSTIQKGGGLLSRPLDLSDTDVAVIGNAILASMAMHSSLL